MTDHIEPHILAHAAARVPSRIVHAMPCPIMEDGTIKPHVTRLWLADGRLTDVVQIKPVYYERRDGAWRPLSEICLYHGNKNIVLRAGPSSLLRKTAADASPRYLQWLAKRQAIFGRELGLYYAPRVPYVGLPPWARAAALTLTVFPDPNVEVTTVDGRCSHTPGAGVSWDTNHDATASSSAFDSANPWYAGAEETAAGVNQYQTNRGFHLYDTSSLTASATVSAATCSLNGGGAPLNTDNDGDDWVNITPSTPASNTAIVTGDYDQCGAIDNPTEYSTRIDIGSWASTYNDFALNAGGLSALSLTAVTKFGLREGHDAIDSAPANNTGNYVDVDSAEGAGTTSDPKLVVTYTLPATGFGGLLSNRRNRLIAA